MQVASRKNAILQEIDDQFGCLVNFQDITLTLGTSSNGLTTQ
jgi:hypothetical protein